MNGVDVVDLVVDLVVVNLDIDLVHVDLDVDLVDRLLESYFES